MNFRFLLQTTILILPLSAGYYAHANSTQVESHELNTQSIKDLSIEEIIVTARKKNENLQDSPLSITAMNEKFLKKANINNLNSVADFTPGFDFAQAFGRQDFRPAIRGQSTIIGGSNAGLFIDGFFVGSGGATLSTSALERIEVVKGPQSALYGRSTLAGAINYVLKKPTELFEGNIHTTFGQDGEQRVELTLRGPINSQLGYMVSVNSYQYDGQYKNGFPGNDTGAPPRSDSIGSEKTNSIAGLLHLSPSDTFYLQTHLLWEKSDDAPYAMALLSSSHNNCAFGPPPSPPEGTPGYGKINLGTFSINATGSAYNNSGYYCGYVNTNKVLAQNHQKTHIETGFYKNMGSQFEALRFGATMHWDINDFVFISKTGYHDYTDESRQDQSFGGNDYYLSGFRKTPARFGLLTEYIGKSNEKSQELTLSSPEQSSIRYRIGSYYYERESTGNGRNSYSAGAVATAYESVDFFLRDTGKRNTKNTAVFGSIEYDISQNIIIGLDIRYNKDTLTINGNDASFSASYDSWLPRLIVDWKATDNMLLYSVLSRGNKPGNFNGGIELRDIERNVEEEKAWNYEIGFKSALRDNQVTFNTALYYIDWENQQLTTNTATFDDEGKESGTSSILTNVGKSSIKGIEISLNSHITHWWNLYLGYSLTDSEIKEFVLSAEQHLTQYGMLSGYEEAAQMGYSYIENGDIIISGTQSPQVSKHQLTISNSFSGEFTSTWDWFTRVDYLYRSKRYAQVYNQAHTGDSHKVNLNIGLSTDKLDISLWVKNLTNDKTSPSLIRYIEVANGRSGPNRAIGITLPQQRSAGISMSYSF